MIIELVDCQTRLCVERGETKHRVTWIMPTVQELRHIQKTTGMTLPAWEAALNALGEMSGDSLDAAVVLVQLVHQRLGIDVAFDEVDFLGPDLRFLPDPEAEVDPEGKAGETPASPHPDGSPASTSGTSTRVASKPKPGTTPPSSGGTSESPP